MNLPTLFKEALPIIIEAAPTIAKVITNPVGTATNFVLPLLAATFDVKPGNIGSLVSSITSDDNAKSKLQQIENDYADIIKSFVNNFNNLSSAEINVKLNFQNQKEL